jgi:hypothetical protein
MCHLGIGWGTGRWPVGALQQRTASNHACVVLPALVHVCKTPFLKATPHTQTCTHRRLLLLAALPVFPPAAACPACVPPVMRRQ